MRHKGLTKRQNIETLINHAEESFMRSYFFESVWVYYSLIDDRLNAALFHLGKENESKSKNGIPLPFQYRKDLLYDIIENENPHYVLDTKLSKEELKQLVKDIYNWAQIRNEFMHSLADKEGVYDDYKDETKKLANEGKALFRVFTSYVMRLKKRTN